MARQRQTAQQWRELIAKQQHSGVSVDAFCTHHGVASSTFFAWRRKLSEQGAPAFVELIAKVEPVAAAPIEVLLNSGVIVRVHEGFNVATLQRVVEALQ